MMPDWRTILCLLLALAVMACGCRRGGDRGTPPPPVPRSRPADPVLAEINGLSVLQSDFLAALRSGRVGGAPELVLDEMLSFTLVLRECRAMGASETCGGSHPVHVRAMRFLEHLYPEDKVCGPISEEDFQRAFDRVAHRRPELKGDPADPETRKLVKERICGSRALQIRRQWVTALRKGAQVRIHEEAVQAAVEALVE